jgi:hypothetical protein
MTFAYDLLSGIIKFELANHVFHEFDLSDIVRGLFSLDLDGEVLHVIYRSGEVLSDLQLICCFGGCCSCGRYILRNSDSSTEKT